MYAQIVNGDFLDGDPPVPPPTVAFIFIFKISHFGKIAKKSRSLFFIYFNLVSIKSCHGQDFELQKGGGGGGHGEHKQGLGFSIFFCLVFFCFGGVNLKKLLYWGKPLE